MSKLKIACFIVIALFSMSCTGLKYQIKRNQAFTGKMMDEILKENDNVFYLGTEYSNASFVWTYKEDTIQVFKLINGKINTQREYKVSSENKWIERLSDESLSKQAFYCAELDGDLIQIKVKKNGSIKQHSLSVNIECFTQREYESEFLNRMTADMKAYNISW